MQLLKSFSLAAILSAATSFAVEPLTVWIMPNGASPKEKLEQNLAEFTKSTGIPTQIQVLDWGVAWNRISTALAAGENLPDVLQLGTTWVPYFASRGEIKALNEFLPQIDSSRFVPVSWNTAHIDSDTTIYSIPWFIDSRPVLGNRRILKENGISPEDVATYDGFVSAVRKINAKKNLQEDGAPIQGYAFPGKSDWNILHNFAPWVWSNGGDFVVKNDNGKWHANILSEKTLLGIAKYLNFVLDSLVPAEALQANTAQVAQRFNNGELGFIVNTAEIITQIHFEGKEGGLSNAKIGKDSAMVLPIPAGEAGSVNFIGGSNLAIPAKNSRKESLNLLLFMTQDENLDYYDRQIGFLPPSKKVLEKWAEIDDYKVLVKTLDNGKTYTTIPEWGDLEQLLVSMFSSVWDLLEIPALYSEEKLYQILKQYSTQIDQRLGYTSTDVMTLAEFQDIWHRSLTAKSEGKTSENDNQAVINENMRKAPWVFAFMVIFGFIFALRKKRK